MFNLSIFHLYNTGVIMDDGLHALLKLPKLTDLNFGGKAVLMLTDLQMWVWDIWGDWQH